MRWLFLLLILSFTSCKSIKKDKDVQKTMDYEKVNESITKDFEEVLSNSQKNIIQNFLDSREETVEEVIETSQVVRVNGKEKTIPVRTTITTKVIVKNERLTENSSSKSDEKNKSSEEKKLNNRSIQTTKDKEVEKESESIDLVSSLLNFFLPGYFKYGLILLVASVIFIIIRKKLKTKKKQL